MISNKKISKNGEKYTLNFRKNKKIEKKILTVKINHAKTLKIHHDIYMNYSQNCIFM